METSYLEGYLSEVASYHSNSIASDVSNELILSARVLEQHFKDKYKVLKASYESRLRQLSDTVAETCDTILNDDIIKELKHEETSAAFIPAHIKEIVESHLTDDREEFLNSTLTKLNQMELEFKKTQDIIINQQSKISELETSLSSTHQPPITADVTSPVDHTLIIEPLQKKLIELEEQFDTLNKSSEAELLASNEKIVQLQEHELKHQHQQASYIKQLEKAYEVLDMKTSHIEELEKELENFTRQDMSRSREIELLERSSMEYTKELSRIQAIESKHAATTSQLQKRIDSLTSQHHHQLNETYELKSKAKYYEEEIVRYEQQLVKKMEEEKIMSHRMSKMMAQVETMLNEEASETTMTIKAYQAKMDEVKQSLGLELQKEKRLVASLTEEVSGLRNMKDLSTLEFKHLHEEHQHISSEVKKLRDAHVITTRTLDESNIKNQDLKMGMKDLELRLKQKEEALLSDLKRKDLEVNLIEEKLKIQYEKKLLTDIQALEQRYSVAATAASNDRDTLQRSVELIKSSLELAPNLLDRSYEAQQHQLQLFSSNHQHDAAIARDRIDSLAAAEVKHQAEIRRVERYYDDEIVRLKDKLRQSKDDAMILREVLDDKQDVLMEKDAVISQLQHTVEHMKNIASSMIDQHVLKENHVSNMFANSPSSKNKNMRYRDSQEDDDVVFHTDTHTGSSSKDQHIIQDLQSQLSSQQASSAQTIQLLQSKLSEALISSSTMSTSLDQSKSKIIDLESDIQRLQSKLVHHEHQSKLLEASKHEISLMKDENRSLQSKNSELQQLIHQLRDQYEHEKQMIQASLNENDTSSAHTSYRLQQELSLCQGQVHSLQNRNDDMTQQLVESENKSKRVEENHQKEIRYLKSQLEEQRNEGIRDQEQYTIMLDNMKKKFESLMTLHDKSIHNTNASDTVSSYTMNSIAKKLQDDLDYERNQVLILQKDVQVYRNMTVELQISIKSSQQRSIQLTQVIESIQEKYRSHLREIKYFVSSLKEEVLSLVPNLSLECKNILRQLKFKSTETLDTFMSSIQSQHEAKLESELEKCRGDVIKELHIKESAEPVIPSHRDRSLRRSYDGDRGSVGKSFSSVGSLRSSRDMNQVDVESSQLQISKSFVAETQASNNESYAINIATIESKVSWYEGLVNVMLETMASHSYISHPAITKLQSLILSFLKTSKLDTHTSRQLTSIKWILTEELQRHAESTSNSRIMLAGELEQSHQEHMLLLELSKLETDSQIKAYQNKIQELLKQLEDERASHTASINEIDKRSRRVMEETILSQKMHDATRIENLRRQIEEEESKRRALQISFREKERSYQEKITAVEEKNIALLQQVEELELKLTKLKDNGIVPTPAYAFAPAIPVAIPFNDESP